MRLSILFLVLGLHVAWAGQTYSQSAVLSLSLKNKTIKEALQTIEKQSEFIFFYSNDAVDFAKKVDVSAKGKSLNEVLDILLAGSNTKYKIIDRQVILYLEEAAAEAIAQQIKMQEPIRGTVIDKDNEPLIGVSVFVKGTTTGTVSDLDGNFTIEAGRGDVLVFSHVGFVKQEIKVEKTSGMTVILREDPKLIDEVVVVGYGSQKKVNLTGAVVQVNAKELEDRPVPNMSQLLQGTVPNMHITFGSGRPGASGSYNIRGVNSIGSNTRNAKPLILIDGIEGNIDRINPRDVESVSVLKDASASAIYGARASYGVILVTTKSGKTNKTSVSYGAKYGFGAPTTSTNYETRGYYSAAINDLFFSAYSGANYTKYTEEDYNELWARRNDKTEHPDRPWVVIDQRDGKDTYVYYANTDWYNYFFDDRRPTWEHSVNINGGSEKVKYFLSGNMFQQKGMFRITPDQYKTYNFRSKMTAELYPWLEVNSNTNFFHSEYFYPGQGGVNNTFNSMTNHALASFVPVNPDGTPTYLTSMSPYQIMDGQSALLVHDAHSNLDKIYEYSAAFEAVFKILPSLDVRANYSYVHYNYQTMNRSTNIPYSKYPGEVSYITDGRGTDQLTEKQTNHWYQAANAYATYTQQLNADHNLKIMGGANYETKYLKDLTMSQKDLLTTELIDFNLATGDITLTGGQNEYAIVGVFYRLNYDFKGRYLFEASGRYDGTSRFMRGHRFGFFPSASAAWRISEEPFFQPLSNAISNLKIRLSYGSLGNQQTGYYDYIQTIDTKDLLKYSFGDGQKAGVAKVSSPNASDLTWETASTGNLGLDVGVSGQRLTFSGDVYVRNTRNMLMRGKDLPSVYGAKEPDQNAADLKTKGWEVSLAWKDIFSLAGKPFNYSFSVGVGDNTSKVTKYDNPTKELGSYYEGQQLGDIWGYIVDGYFKSDEEARNYGVDQSSVNNIINSSAKDPGVHAGDLKFVDLDGDNEISAGANTADKPGDRRIIGNSLPRYTYGFNAGASWNGIDLSLFLQGVGRQHWYPGTNAIGFWGPYARPYTTFIPDDFLSKVWSEDNPDAYFPRPRGYIALNSKNRSLGVYNDRYLQDLAYCRLKNLTVGYTLPARWMSKIGLDRCRIYFSGENILTFSKIDTDYIDPEQASASNSITTSTSTAKIYPWSKTYSFGIDITF